MTPSDTPNPPAEETARLHKQAWEDAATRLINSEANGLVREGWTMTTVRMSDAGFVAQQLLAWHEEVCAVRAYNQELREARDGVLAENSRLRERINKASSALSP